MARTELRLVSTPVTLVDSCVFLDLTTQDPNWCEWSENALAEAAQEGPLAVNPVIYAEISTDFPSIEELESAVPATDFRREPLPWPAAFLAGRAHLRYRKRGGTKLTPMPDFYIGAHAAVAGFRILTRDSARYRTYFPTVPLIVP